MESKARRIAKKRKEFEDLHSEYKFTSIPFHYDLTTEEGLDGAIKALKLIKKIRAEKNSSDETKFH